MAKSDQDAKATASDDKVKKPAVKKEAAPKAEAKAPVAKKEAAPKAEAKAPAVKKEAAPKAEAKAPAVKKEAAPKAEAKAPVVKKEAAPKAEAKAPAVKKEAAPKAEAKAPVAKKEAAPKAEAKAPVAKKEAAPKAEAKAPVAKKEAAPKAEAKAPVVKKEAAPKAEAKAPVVKKEAAPQVEVKAPVAKKEAAPKAPAAKKDTSAKSYKHDDKSNPQRNRLKKYYFNTVMSALQKEFKYKNINEVPRLEKITLNMRLGDVKDNSKSFNIAVEELAIIAGQKPVITKAKKSVANFKVREGMNLGAKVTLRNSIMYEFYDKLVSIALPRVRDFRGVATKSFDGRGNYSMGIKEQLIFPEINYDVVEKIRGFDIVFVTSAKTDEEARELLRKLGMPFKAD